MQDSYHLFTENDGKLYCNECGKEAFMGLKAGPWCISCKNQFEKLKSS
jgi:hypothetical protein